MYQRAAVTAEVASLYFKQVCHLSSNTDENVWCSLENSRNAMYRKML